MVHSDASNFAPSLTREETYAQVLEQAEALFTDQRNWVCNLANTASLLWHAYHSLPFPGPSVNWAGFYVLSPSQQNQLILGPFQGKVACQTILFSRGVCGTAAAKGETIVVQDVDSWTGHIACDGETGSEIVVPIWDLRDGEVNGDGEGEWKGKGGGKRVVGVIDVDCKEKGAFGEVDRVWLERLAVLLGGACDWA